jgi:uncharacterized paraquat-inducible protein A
MAIVYLVFREVIGIVGVTVESRQDFDEALTNFSVFTLVQVLMNEATFLGTAGDYIGLGNLSALFIVTILVEPILQILTLLHQWFMPLSQKQRTRMFVLTKIFQAWQYVEVYVLAIIVSAAVRHLEMPSHSQGSSATGTGVALGQNA